MRVEEKVALEIESQGYIVIRTFQAGCPDLIAIPSELAEAVCAIEVKGPGDHVRPSQVTTIAYLKGKGINAFFQYTTPRNPHKASKHHRTHADILAFEEDCYHIGWTAFSTGTSMDNPHEKYTNNWYRFRANWQNGHDDAAEQWRAMQKAQFLASKPPQPE